MKSSRRSFLAALLLPFASFDKASKEVLNDPHDLAVGPDGRIYVAGKFRSRIAVMDAELVAMLEAARGS